jgi:hypothetical protein
MLKTLEFKFCLAAISASVGFGDACGYGAVASAAVRLLRAASAAIGGLGRGLKANWLALSGRSARRKL